MLKKSLTVLILTTILSVINFNSLNSKVHASSVSPNNQTFNVQPEDLSFGELTYTNDTKSAETVTLSISSYDTKNEKTLSEKPFITLKQTKLTVKAKSTVQINYIISIPKETPSGTYSNIIFIQKQETGKTTGNISIVPSIGSLFVFHVSDSTTSVDKIFYDKSDIQLIVKHKGLPYLSETEFEYVYTNNSNFVFRPEGEIRILDSKSNQLMERFTINEDKKAIYPGEKIGKTYTVNIWKDYKSILQTKSIVSKTYSDIDGSSVLNKVDLNIINQVGVIGAVCILLIITLLSVVISSVIKTIKSKRTKESKK